MSPSLSSCGVKADTRRGDNGAFGSSMRSGALEPTVMVQS